LLGGRLGITFASHYVTDARMVPYPASQVAAFPKPKLINRLSVCYYVVGAVARTLDPTAHAIRRDAFVDAAQRLIQSQGFDQMSIQDVLDALATSRGAFYHYFDSKVALLEAVVERMVVDGTASLKPVLADPHLSALDKLRRLIAGVNAYKSARRDLVLGFTQVWFSDDNVLVRDKLRRLTVAHLTPLLAAIVQQGITEGTFTLGNLPEPTARVLVSLWQGLNELASELFLERQAGTVTLEAVERTIAAYLEAFERILGVPSGSLPLDHATIREWFA
jgi:AcrR family transcriptional regulator